MYKRWISFLTAASFLAAVTACSSDDSDMVAGSNEEGPWCSVNLTPATLSYEIVGNSLKLEDNTGDWILLQRVSESGGRPVFGQWRSNPTYAGDVEMVGLFVFAEGSISVTSVCQFETETISPSVSCAAEYTDTTITVLDTKENKQYF